MAMRTMMNPLRTKWVATVWLGLFLFAGPGPHPARADNGQAPAPGMTASRHFQIWLKDLREDARRRGISQTTLDAALTGIAPVQRVIELDRHQPEFTRTFWSYLDRRVSDQRIAKGRTLLARHRRLLDAIHARYGVPPRYLVAFWGLETNFGTYTGGFRVIDALATLAYDHRRSAFFRTQLLDALAIVEADHITPQKMTGSWAGAMGQLQFMPSTFIGHAVDYTGDGKKDIWQSLPDAFASAANYLADMGWQANTIWGREVRLPAGFNLNLATMETGKKLAAWSALGVRRADGGPLPRARVDGSVILPQGHNGPAFMVYHNFRVILRWNRSINYALAVGHLADRIVGLPPLLNGRAAQHPPLSRADMQRIQARLSQLGFDAGTVDGVLGPRTRAALREFQRAHALPPDGYPTPAILDSMLPPVPHTAPSTSDAPE